jgi:hypothetical protein
MTFTEYMQQDVGGYSLDVIINNLDKEIVIDDWRDFMQTHNSPTDYEINIMLDLMFN